MQRALITLSLGLFLLAVMHCGGSTTDPIPNTTSSTSASSSSTGSSGASSSSGISSSSSSGTSGTSSGEVDASQGCSPACGPSRLCCDGRCVNPANDPTACGACGVTCNGAKPFCDGACKATPCEMGGDACSTGETCCGESCCKQGQICCQSEGSVSGGPQCFTPTAEQKTCPQGCAPLCISDRDQKKDFEPVDRRAVLDAVSRMPMTTWSYKNDPNHTRHLGPMAQDFKSELDVGATDRAYDPIDAHGAAFVSIQELRAMLDEQNVRLLRLEEENRALKKKGR